MAYHVLLKPLGDFFMFRYLIITKKTCIILAAVALFIVFAILIFSTKSIVIPTAKANKLLPVYSTKRINDKKISISFDAAWGADDTEEIINILGKHQIKATFFVVGEWVDKYPEAVKALHNAGHEIQNHSDTHPHLTNLSKDEIMEEIQKCNQKIETVTGIKPTLLRPPYGDYNNQVIETVEGMNMTAIQWSVDSLDWKELSAQEIIDRVKSAITPGGIVLFHNAAKNTPAALPALLESLIAEGYEFVPISQLIYKENYTIDHTGMQIPD